MSKQVLKTQLIDDTQKHVLSNCVFSQSLTTYFGHYWGIISSKNIYLILFPEFYDYFIYNICKFVEVVYSYSPYFCSKQIMGISTVLFPLGEDLMQELLAAIAFLMTAMELSMDHRIWVLVDQESDKPATIYLEIYFVLSVAIPGIARKLVSTSNLFI